MQIIIVAHISRKTAIGTAKETASREMEKLERTWDRDDIVSSDDEFAEMAAVVSKFVCFADGTWELDALSKVAEVRSRESEKLGEILDSLYISITVIIELTTAEEMIACQSIVSPPFGSILPNSKRKSK